jgi:hypothetical protein
MRDKRLAYRILVGKPEGKKLLERLGVNGYIILEWIVGKWGGGEYVEWIHLTENREQWRVLVYMVMNNLRVP